jgi:uncharacterized membrane protein
MYEATDSRDSFARALLATLALALAAILAQMLVVPVYALVGAIPPVGLMLGLFARDGWQTILLAGLAGAVLTGFSGDLLIAISWPLAAWAGVRSAQASNFEAKPKKLLQVGMATFAADFLIGSMAAIMGETYGLWEVLTKVLFSLSFNLVLAWGVLLNYPCLAPES